MCRGRSGNTFGPGGGGPKKAEFSSMGKADAEHTAMGLGRTGAGGGGTGLARGAAQQDATL